MYGLGHEHEGAGIRHGGKKSERQAALRPYVFLGRYQPFSLKNVGQMRDKMTFTQTSKKYVLYKLVPGAGIEPARPQGARDFKSLVST